MSDIFPSVVASKKDVAPLKRFSLVLRYKKDRPSEWLDRINELSLEYSKTYGVSPIEALETIQALSIFEQILLFEELMWNGIDWVEIMKIGEA